MKYIHSSETLNVPEGGECDCSSRAPETQKDAPAKVHEELPPKLGPLKEEQLLTCFSLLVKVVIKSRLVTVEGPRGTLWSARRRGKRRF